jgi:hypothetical protein
VGIKTSGHRATQLNKPHWANWQSRRTQTAKFSGFESRVRYAEMVDCLTWELVQNITASTTTGNDERR